MKNIITMNHNIYIAMIMCVLVFIVSCNEEEDHIDPSISGCTNEFAANYNPNATIDDGSCIVLGCTDENATNYDPEATDDNGSCEYSVAYMLTGNWNIVSLEYTTEIDLSFLESVIGLNPGNQDISGEATDAGSWSFEYPEYLYNNNLNFITEPITILTFEVPGIPVDVSSDGTWSLTNNNLTTIDAETLVESSYEILSIQNDVAFMNGVIPFSQEIMGYNIDLEIEVEMQLEKE